MALLHQRMMPRPTLRLSHLSGGRKTWKPAGQSKAHNYWKFTLPKLYVALTLGVTGNLCLISEP